MSTTDNTASASPELEATKTPAQPKRTNSIDMLHGPLLGKLIIFAVPLALSSIISQLFNSADAVVAGRFINSGALAAVGGVAPVISLLIGLFVGLSVGANVAIAIRIGHGRMDLVKNAVQTTAVLTLVCGALLTVVGMLITGPILDAIGMPAEATEEAAWYLRIYFAGSVFFLAYNFGSAVLRAKGDTRRPLYALAAAMLLNVVLNVIAVTVFNAGVIGIAIATDISNALSAAIVIRMLLHEEDAFRLEPRHLAVDRKALKMILYIGLPSGLQSMVFSFSNVIIQAAINSFGADSTAGSAATMNYEYYTYFFVSAFSQAAVTFIGQNFAAGNLKRCDSIVRICMAAAVLSALTLSAIFVGLGNISLGAFTTEAGALGYGTIRMWHVELLECMTSTYEVTAGAMRGMGWSVLPTIVVIVGSCLLRIALHFLGVPVDERLYLAHEHLPHHLDRHRHYHDCAVLLRETSRLRRRASGAGASRQTPESGCGIERKLRKMRSATAECQKECRRAPWPPSKYLAKTSHSYRDNRHPVQQIHGRLIGHIKSFVAVTARPTHSIHLAREAPSTASRVYPQNRPQAPSE